MEQIEPAQITSQPTSTPETVSSETQLPKSRLFLLLIVLLILFTVSTAFLAYQNWQLSQKISQMEQEASPTPSPPVDPTANWKTYTSDEYKFSFKYPNNFEIEESRWGSRLKNIQVVVNKTEKNNFVIGAQTGYTSSDLTYHLDVTSTSEHELAGLRWKEFFLPEGYGGAGGEGENGRVIPVYAIKAAKDEVLYTIQFFNTLETDEVQDQILSTFKFKN